MVDITIIKVIFINRDVVTGRDLGLATKEHIATSIDKLKDKAENSLNGNGRKHKIFYFKKKFKRKRYI